MCYDGDANDEIHSTLMLGASSVRFERKFSRSVLKGFLGCSSLVCQVLKLGSGIYN